MKKQTKWTAKRLTVLWVVSLLVGSGISLAYMVYVTCRHGMYHLTVTSVQLVITWLAVVLYYYPLLFVIKARAKEENSRKILIASRVLIGVLTYWLVMGAITFLFL
jgi:hypothetical protein